MTSDDGSLIVAFGRGNSGTRMLTQALYASGVYMGETLNDSGDKVPVEEMYEACRLVGQHVSWNGGLSWSFGRLLSSPIDPEFVEKLESYLQDLFTSGSRRKGWKLPETTLALPWVARLFPRARYVHIVRDPRDCLLGSHLTDDLRRCGVQCPPTDDVLEQRVASWKYQLDIVRSTHPSRFISIRYEDLVLEHDATMKRLEAFLDMPLARIVVDEAPVGKWRADPRLVPYLGPLLQDMRELGYD